MASTSVGKGSSGDQGQEMAAMIQVGPPGLHGRQSERPATRAFLDPVALWPSGCPAGLRAVPTCPGGCPGELAAALSPSRAPRAQVASQLQKLAHLPCSGGIMWPVALDGD